MIICKKKKLSLRNRTAFHVILIIQESDIELFKAKARKNDCLINNLFFNTVEFRLVPKNSDGLMDGYSHLII